MATARPKGVPLTHHNLVAIGLILTIEPVPVVPVWISGTYEAMPRGQRRLRRHPVTITFGESIDADTLRYRGEGREPYERISAALHDRVAELGRVSRNCREQPRSHAMS